MRASLVQLVCWTGIWTERKWSVLAQPLLICCREGGAITGRLGCSTALVELLREAAGRVVVVSRLKQLE